MSSENHMKNHRILFSAKEQKHNRFVYSYTITVPSTKRKKYFVHRAKDKKLLRISVPTEAQKQNEN